MAGRSRWRCRRPRGATGVVYDREREAARRLRPGRSGRRAQPCCAHSAPTSSRDDRWPVGPGRDELTRVASSRSTDRPRIGLSACASCDRGVPIRAGRRHPGAARQPRARARRGVPRPGPARGPRRDGLGRDADRDDDLKAGNVDGAETAAATTAGALRSLADYVAAAQPQAAKQLRDAADAVDKATSSFPAGPIS